MGTLTTSELISEVKAHLANRDDLTDAEYITALNLMQTRLARKHDFEELRTIESGSFVISGTPATDKFLAFSALGVTNPREIFSFRIITSDGRSRKLKQRSYRYLDENVPEPEYNSTGVPTDYIIWAESFEFWRVPDSTYNYEIRMSKWPTALVASPGSAVSDFREKDDVLIMLTVSYLYNRLGEYERGARFWNVFKDMWADAQLEDRTLPDLSLSPGLVRPSSSKPWSDPFIRS